LHFILLVGVDYEEPEEIELISRDSFGESIREELEERDLLPLSSKNENLPELLKIFGYLLGDGTVYDKNVVFYGKKEDLKEIRKDISSLGYGGSIYERERKHNIDGNKFSATETSLKVSARSLVELLRELGYPKGDKTGTEVRVPSFMGDLPKWMVRLFLASFFGAEMSKPKTSNGYNFYMPEVKFSSKKEDLNKVPKFLREVQGILEEFGVDSTVSVASEKRDKVVYRLLIGGQADNLLNLWEKIGYEYNMERNSLSAAAIVYLKLKKSVLSKRTRNQE